MNRSSLNSTLFRSCFEFDKRAWSCSGASRASRASRWPSERIGSLVRLLTGSRMPSIEEKRRVESKRVVDKSYLCICIRSENHLCAWLVKRGMK